MNTTTKTVEQLKAEAAAAQDALEAAEKAERDAKHAAEEAERKRKYDEARVAEMAKLKALATALVAQLRERGVAAELRGDGGLIVLPQIDGKILFAEQYVSSGYRRSSLTGRYVAVLDGDYRREFKEVRFPPIKAGGYNAAKIAERIKDRAQVIAAREAREAREKATIKGGEAIAREVRAAAGMIAADDSVVKSVYQTGYYANGRGGRYISSTHTPEAGKVFLALGTGEWTPQQAAVLLDALKRARAMAPKKKEGS